MLHFFKYLFKKTIMKKQLFLLSLFFSGCISGPNIAKSDIEIPKKFIESKEAGKIKNVNEWWQNFYEAAINDHIDRIIENSCDSSTAKAQIQRLLACYNLEKAKRSLIFFQIKEKSFTANKNLIKEN